MKWVRLLQLSQTMGVNDIITAFWKHKPACASLLPLQISLCSVKPQKVWAASASAIQTTVLPFARVDHCHQRHSLPLPVGLKQQFVNLAESGRWRRADSSWEKLEQPSPGRSGRIWVQEVCSYPDLNQNSALHNVIFACHENMRRVSHSS